MSISDNIKKLRQMHNLSQAEFGRIAGVSDKAVSTWENGTKTPRMGAIQRLADHFGISKSMIIEGDSLFSDNSVSFPDNIIPLPKPHYIPLVGTIACGEPLLAEENLDGVVPIPKYIHADFGLRCKGDSMVGARILDGDIACIRQQPDVEDGEIAAVLIDGEATLKRVYKIPGRLQLRPENPSFPVLEYTGPELEQVHILGKAVYFISPVK